MSKETVSRAAKPVPRPIPGLGLRLYQARAAASTPEKRISQEAAGAYLGKRGATVGRWESGDWEPSLMDLVGLAKLYGVDLVSLAFGGEGARADLVANYAPPPTPEAEDPHRRARALVAKHLKRSGRKSG